MLDRPTLGRELDGTTFRDYYYLKDELIAFCRENGLPVSGGKLELTERIAHFLDTGEILSPKARRTPVKPGSETELTESSVIKQGFVCSERHRAFFREKIGRGFSFNVPFQKWLKSNAGKTYGDAITAYREILEEKRKGVSHIDKQFEYNTYIRDFFADNPGKTLEQAIVCWKYKKSLRGHNRYEPSDLTALKE